MATAECSVLTVGPDGPSIPDTEGPQFEVRSAPTAQRGLERLAEATDDVDCIVARQDLPDTDGLSLLDRIRKLYGKIPFILHLGREADYGDVPAEVGTYDAADYYRRLPTDDRNARLGNRIRGLVDRVRSRRRQRGELKTERPEIDGDEDGTGYRDGLGGTITTCTGYQDERRRNQRRFEAVFEDPGMLVGLLDLEGTVLHVNETAIAYVDADLEDVVGKRFWETPWWTEDDRERVREWIDRAAGGEYVTYEAEHEGSDGEPLFVDGTFRPVTDETGMPTSLIVSGRDVTDHRVTERRLEETRDKLAVLNQVVRHDLRNHMQVVRGRARLLTDHVDGDGETHLEEILLSTDEAIDLTRTARELSQTVLESGDETRPVPLGETVRSAVETARSRYPEASITVSGPGVERGLASGLDSESKFESGTESGSDPESGTESDPNFESDHEDRVRVRADDMLESVVHNLLQNAIVHNDTDEPTVRISLERRESTSTAVLCVADDGPGIPDSREESIFGRGNRGLESSGTGVGLYLVRTLVEQYDGSISFEDNEPRGTVFRVRLPLADEEAETETAADPDGETETAADPD